MTRPVTIAPSVLAADFKRLGDEVRAVDQVGADWIHVDIMDGRLVPEISFGPSIVRAIRKATALPLNVHLMVVEPERSLERYRDAGADHLLIQAEPGSTVPLHRVLSQVRELVPPGRGSSRRSPGSSMSFMVDVILVMTVNPGFGGQAFLPEMLPKMPPCANCATHGAWRPISRWMAARSLAPRSSPSRPGPMSSRRERRSSVQTTTPRPSPTCAILVSEPAKPWTARSLSQCLPMPKNLKRRAHRRSCWRH